MYPPPPPDPWPGDPKDLRASAEQDFRHSVGLAHDVGHVLGFLTRIVTWPARALIRLVRR